MKKILPLLFLVLIITGCGTQNPTFMQANYVCSLQSPSFLQKSTMIYMDKYMESSPITLNNQIYSIVFDRNNSTHLMQIDNIITNQHISTITIGIGEYGSAIVSNNTVYVFLSNNSGTIGNQVTTISSTDLINWTAPQIVFNDSLNSIYNISVCADATGFMMAYEIGRNGNYVHKFAHSATIMGTYAQIGGTYTSYGYAACPTIRYDAQYHKYYILYLNNLGGGNFDTFIYRTTDLRTFEDSNIPAFMALSNEGTNNSDVDFTELNGQTYFLYAIGDQLTWGSIKIATAPMTNLQYLRSFFPVP